MGEREREPERGARERSSELGGSRDNDNQTYPLLAPDHTPPPNPNPLTADARKSSRRRGGPYRVPSRKRAKRSYRLASP